jgi:hypothetical protein
MPHISRRNSVRIGCGPVLLLRMNRNMRSAQPLNKSGRPEEAKFEAQLTASRQIPLTAVRVVTQTTQ